MSSLSFSPFHTSPLSTLLLFPLLSSFRSSIPTTHPYFLHSSSFSPFFPFLNNKPLFISLAFYFILSFLLSFPHFSSFRSHCSQVNKCSLSLFLFFSSLSGTMGIEPMNLLDHSLASCCIPTLPHPLFLCSFSKSSLQPSRVFHVPPISLVVDFDLFQRLLGIGFVLQLISVLIRSIRSFSACFFNNRSTIGISIKVLAYC